MSNQDWSKNLQFWSELQKRIHKREIKMFVNIPHRQGPWQQTLNDRKIIMDISPEISDGLYTYLVVTFYGRTRKKDLKDLSKFMGYRPFVSYKSKDDGVSKTTFEWALQSDERLEDLRKMDNLRSIVHLENYFRPYVELRIRRNFFETGGPTIEAFRAKLAEDPDSRSHDMPIKELLPFLLKVRPNVSREQSLFNMTIICLKKGNPDFDEVIKYGLYPLLAANIISREEARLVTKWFTEMIPEWDASKQLVVKIFTIDGVKYKLHLESYRYYLDLILSLA
jgi:hypothetical protein